MNEFRKPFGRFSANALRRTIGSYELRILRFELAQLLDQLVVLAIRNLGVFVEIVEIFVALNFFPQIARSLFRLMVALARLRP